MITRWIKQTRAKGAMFQNLKRFRVQFSVVEAQTGLVTTGKRFKLQHLLTDQLDTYDEMFAPTLSHDNPSVNVHFMGSCLLHMCLPYSASARPRSDYYHFPPHIRAHVMSFSPSCALHKCRQAVSMHAQGHVNKCISIQHE